VTCPLEVLKTRLQSSSLALRPMFQVQLGTLSGTGVIRPGTVTPGLLQVLRYVPTAAVAVTICYTMGSFMWGGGLTSVCNWLRYFLLSINVLIV